MQLLSEPKTNSATENHSLLKHRHLQLQMAFQQSEQKSDFADKSIMSCANDALAGAASIVASAPCYEDMCSLSSDSDDKYLGDSSASETGIYTVGSPRKKAQKPPYPASSVDTDSGVKVRPPNPPTKRFQSDGRVEGMFGLPLSVSIGIKLFFRLLRSLQRAGHVHGLLKLIKQLPTLLSEMPPRALGAPPKPLVVHAVCVTTTEAVAAVCDSVMRQQQEAESAMRSRDAVTSGEPPTESISNADSQWQRHTTIPAAAASAALSVVLQLGSSMPSLDKATSTIKTSPNRSRRRISEHGPATDPIPIASTLMNSNRNERFEMSQTLSPGVNEKISSSFTRRKLMPPDRCRVAQQHEQYGQDDENCRSPSPPKRAHSSGRRHANSPMRMNKSADNSSKDNGSKVLPIEPKDGQRSKQPSPPTLDNVTANDKEQNDTRSYRCPPPETQQEQLQKLLYPSDDFGYKNDVFHVVAVASADCSDCGVHRHDLNDGSFGIPFSHLSPSSSSSSFGSSDTVKVYPRTSVSDAADSAIPEANSMSVETCSRAVVHAIWNAVEELAAFPQLLDDNGGPQLNGKHSTIPGGMPVVGISDLSASRQRILGRPFVSSASKQSSSDRHRNPMATDVLSATESKELRSDMIGRSPSDYSLTLSALTALAVKQGDLPALLKAVRLLLFGSAFYIPPPSPIPGSAAPLSSASKNTVLAKASFDIGPHSASASSINSSGYVATSICSLR